MLGFAAQPTALTFGLLLNGHIMLRHTLAFLSYALKEDFDIKKAWDGNNRTNKR